MDHQILQLLLPEKWKPESESKLEIWTFEISTTILRQRNKINKFCAGYYCRVGKKSLQLYTLSRLRKRLAWIDQVILFTAPGISHHHPSNSIQSLIFSGTHCHHQREGAEEERRRHFWFKIRNKWRQRSIKTTWDINKSLTCTPKELMHYTRRRIMTAKCTIL